MQEAGVFHLSCCSGEGKNRSQHPRVARAPCQGQQREAPHPAAHPCPFAPTCRSFSVCPSRMREAGAFSVVVPRPLPGANRLEVKERGPCQHGGNRERNKYFRLRRLQRLATLMTQRRSGDRGRETQGRGQPPAQADLPAGLLCPLTQPAARPVTMLPPAVVPGGRRLHLPWAGALGGGRGRRERGRRERSQGRRENKGHFPTSLSDSGILY